MRVGGIILPDPANLLPVVCVIATTKLEGVGSILSKVILSQRVDPNASPAQTRLEALVPYDSKDKPEEGNEERDMN